MFSVATVGEYTVEIGLTETEQVYAAQAPGALYAKIIARAKRRK
jgi:hypothetical protein